MTPTFSICHATARTNPAGWQTSHDAWLANADHPDKVEYTLAIHHDDWQRSQKNSFGNELVTYTGARTSVHGWNVAAASSHGQILILNADDFFPPPSWDSLLCAVMPRTPSAGFVIHVSTDAPNVAEDRKLMTLGIISRPLCQRWGYALYPAYESMYSDNDMTEHAYQDGLVIQAFDLVFEHRHPAFGKAPNDGIYRKQNRPEAYDLGRKILEQRRKDRFAK
jgi:hypothetical protein